MSEATTSVSRGRQVGFSVSIGLFLLLGGLLTVIEGDLPHLVTGWFPGTDADEHRLHDMVIGWFFMAMIAAAVTQLWRNSQRPAALHQAMAIPGLVFIAELASGQPDPPPLLFVVLAVAAGALHPEREQVWSLGPWDPLRLGWAAIAAVPLAIFIGDHIRLQSLDLAGDPHAAEGHWSAMAAVALAIVVLGILGSQRRVDARFPAISAAVVLGIHGLISLLYADLASALPAGWAWAALAWVAGWLALTLSRES